jgi:hypothetical protein
MSMYRELVGYGVRPRVAAAVSSVFPDRRTASSEGLRVAVAGGGIELCIKMASMDYGADTDASDESEDLEAGEVAEDLEALLNQTRDQEAKDGREAAKLGYAVAKVLGEDDEAALCAAMLAFTRVPRRTSDELETIWFEASQ